MNLAAKPLSIADKNNLPLAAALAALHDLPALEPVPSVTMAVDGRLAIVGDAAAALGWAERLVAQRQVTVIAVGGLPADAATDAVADCAVEAAEQVALDGHLGAFRLRWCAGESDQAGEFDLVLDLCAEPLLKRVELPTGYAAPGRDPLDQALAVIDLLAFNGEYEKPRYVALKEKLCAHSRSQKPGCSNCLDACATSAIVAHGDTVRVDPYLCQGCGTCSTVCPSGALAYQYPRVTDTGRAIRAQLAAYQAAGGEKPCLLFHSAEAGARALTALHRAGHALPGNVIPVAVWSADSVGLDLMLGAIAFGACRVAVLGAGSHDLGPLLQQSAIGRRILIGLGYAGDYLRVVDAEQTGWLAELAAASLPAPLPAAEFHLLADKRTTLEFVIDHLRKHAPAAPAADLIVLPEGAPFGAVSVSDACTLCMSCAGACPAGALKAAADAPRLSFIERACVQCGLCAETCPEQAIALLPRLLLEQRGRERVLREAEVFCCTACGKPMGAAPTINSMLAKLAGHSMFATPEARARLTMCADCRVVDLVKNENSLKAWEMTE